MVTTKHNMIRQSTADMLTGSEQTLRCLLIDPNHGSKIPKQVLLLPVARVGGFIGSYFKVVAMVMMAFKMRVPRTDNSTEGSFASTSDNVYSSSSQNTTTAGHRTGERHCCHDW